MPIFIKTESRSLSGRLFHAGTFAFLTIGGLTMLYPFLLMFSGAFRSEMDENDLDMVPGYFHQETALYQKFLENKYQQRIVRRNQAHMEERSFAFQFIPAPEVVRDQAMKDFRKFYSEVDFPLHWQLLGGVDGNRIVPAGLRELRNRVKGRFGNDLRAFTEQTGIPIAGWQQIEFPPPRWLSQNYQMEDTVVSEYYVEMLHESPIAMRQLVSLSGNFLDLVIYPRFPTVNALNEAFGLNLDTFQEFRLPRTVPPTSQAAFRHEWLQHVLEDLNTSFVAIEGEATADFQEFVRRIYDGRIAELNQAWNRDHESFSAISLPTGEFLTGAQQEDYREFLQTLPPERWRLDGPEYLWFEWLAAQYPNIEALNAAYGTTAVSFEDIWLPVAEYELQHVRDHRWQLTREFASRNFVNVIDAAFVEGRIFYNTIIYCTLAVLLAILINPLAAYALSRFRLPGTHKILLVMMAVMAFPPMVTTIPVFIMMKQFGLMNTFAALLFPTIASGYLIYLLKGFFDSLPKELYEAAQIEGASELRMFFMITMALSKPILAVVALNAFNSAYTVFLYALIVAPEQDMWLLSVWLYQYRDTVSMGGVFASVILASIPPLLVFIFAQNIILRGIVVPVEK